VFKGLEPAHDQDIDQDEYGGKGKAEVPEDLVRDMPFPVPFHGQFLGREG